MRILYYDCFAGISGDMNLAAMLGLGVDPETLRAGLSGLGLDDEFELRITEDARNGIHGLRVDVVLKHGHDHQHEHEHDHHHEHDHDHAHGHEHQHAHEHEHEHQHTHEHEHSHDHAPEHHHHHDHGHQAQRNLNDIEAIILASDLDQAVKDTSLEIFRRVAEAEGKVHGQPAREVHFHEVGATDSIVDIVGAAICLHALKVDEVWSRPPELGGGFVNCAHGRIPVPAPATVEILHGIPATRGAVNSEATTPTGAAILAALATRFTADPALIVDRTAYGIGHRHTDIPNVLRAHLASPA